MGLYRRVRQRLVAQVCWARPEHDWRDGLDEKIIQKLLDLDKQADHVRAKAEMDAARRVERAMREAETLVTQAEEEARSEADALLREARDWARSERERILAEADQEVHRLQALADRNSEAATKYVIERLIGPE